MEGLRYSFQFDAFFSEPSINPKIGHENYVACRVHNGTGSQEVLTQREAFSQFSLYQLGLPIW